MPAHTDAPARRATGSARVARAWMHALPAWRRIAEASTAWWRKPSHDPRYLRTRRRRALHEARWVAAIVALSVVLAYLIGHV